MAVAAHPLTANCNRTIDPSVEVRVGAGRRGQGLLIEASQVRAEPPVEAIGPHQHGPSQLDAADWHPR